MSTTLTLANADTAKMSTIHRCEGVDGTTDDYEDEPTVEGYLNESIRFPDGSLWMCTKALSQVKYQQGQPPFEATQVYDCICVDDPNGAHPEDQNAFIKVKYQVQGTPESTAFFFGYAQTHQAEFFRARKKHGGSAIPQDVIEDSKYADDLLQLATQPADAPRRYTIQECQALGHLKDAKSEHTPQLLDVKTGLVGFDVDELVMTHGYVFFILMTKVPGERLDYDMFWNKPLHERQRIREAFKKAITAVRSCELNPHDWSMHNIMCYIVDFEDYESWIWRISRTFRRSCGRINAGRRGYRRRMAPGGRVGLRSKIVRVGSYW